MTRLIPWLADRDPWYESLVPRAAAHQPGAHTKAWRPHKSRSPKVGIVGALLIAASILRASPSPAQPANGPNPEAWVKAKIEAGEPADLNSICGAVDPRNDNDPAWRKPCRQIGHEFLEQLLLRKDIAPLGVALYHASVIGLLDLGNAHVDQAFGLVDSHLDGGLRADRAEFAEMVWLDGDRIADRVTAYSARFHNDFFIRRGLVMGDFAVGEAIIDGDLEVGGTRFGKSWNGENLHVLHSLQMASTQFAEDLNLHTAKVEGTFDATGAIINKQINGNRLFVGQSLFLSGSHFTSANLTNAKIEGTLVLKKAIAGSLQAEGLQTGGALFLDEGARFDGPVSFIYAHIGENVVLAGGQFTSIDFSGASIEKDLRLAFPGQKPSWKPDPQGAAQLTLRNTRAGGWEDTMDGWPPVHRVELEGFSYDHLGSLDSEPAESGTRTRSAADWADLLGRNATYSPQPYVHLAAVLTGEGRRDDGDTILFYGRERERQEVCARHAWVQCGWLGLLRWTVGYGIGNRTFMALGWAAGLMVFGFVVLFFGVSDARRNGVAWCLGASLSRIVPIEFNKEFTEFFYDPQRSRFRGWQLTVFAGITLLSALLGLFVVGAITGLTQRG
jgi:hypothetical protein